MSSIGFFIKRTISTSSVCNGKRNFRKFPLYNKRGSRIFKQQQASQQFNDMPIYKRGVRDTGYYLDGKYIEVPEMIPQLIVPDLKDCKLKPYVSYRTPDVIQDEFTAEDLFNVVYAKKITEDFKSNSLDKNNNPLQPSEYEKLTPSEALHNSRKTGADIM